jgi:hypothetical protein
MRIFVIAVRDYDSVAAVRHGEIESSRSSGANHDRAVAVLGKFAQ